MYSFLLIFACYTDYCMRSMWNRLWNVRECGTFKRKDSLLLVGWVGRSYVKQMCGWDVVEMLFTFY